MNQDVMIPFRYRFFFLIKNCQSKGDVVDYVELLNHGKNKSS
jgi:hypothetical protein